MSPCLHVSQRARISVIRFGEEVSGCFLVCFAMVCVVVLLHRLPICSSEHICVSDFFTFQNFKVGRWSTLWNELFKRQGKRDNFGPTYCFLILRLSIRSAETSAIVLFSSLCTVNVGRIMCTKRC